MIINKDEIITAKKQLESNHHYGAILHELNEFSYIESSIHGQYTRHHFYQGLCRGLIYVALCKEEQKEIEKQFFNLLTDDYIYFDSVLLGSSDTLVHHRFYHKDSLPQDFIFLNDDLTITQPKDDEFYDYE